MGDCYITRRGGSANGGNGMPSYTYTGVCEEVTDDYGNWRLKFLTSGLLTIKKHGNAKDGIDLFLVGGGGGTYDNDPAGASGGGGGGYTLTKRALYILPGKTYQIYVGAGGQAGADGGRSFAFGHSASGGKGTSTSNGGNGGSGGATYNNGNGGSDGGNGTGTGGTPGTGQGTTTREFGESDGDLYSGGGAGSVVTGGITVSGGEGGGGGMQQDGEDNTGGGAGGANGGTSNPQSHTGGSGIVIMRNTRQHAIKITQQPQDVTAAEGANALFTVTASGNGLTYQWQFLPTGSGANWSNTSATGATTSQLTIQALSYRNGYQYHCVITDSNGNQVTSAEATLTVS